VDGPEWSQPSRLGESAGVSVTRCEPFVILALTFYPQKKEEKKKSKKKKLKEKKTQRRYFAICLPAGEKKERAHSAFLTFEGFK